jgi:hypothetical protein
MERTGGGGGLYDHGGCVWGGGWSEEEEAAFAFELGYRQWPPVQKRRALAAARNLLGQGQAHGTSARQGGVQKGGLICDV